MTSQRVGAFSICLLLGTLTGCGRAGDGEAVERGAPNVLLITIDTLRADRLGCYGYRVDTSPTVDRLARRGVRFADCTVQWPKTWPSMASLLTGAYPKTTGIQLVRRVMPSSLLRLPVIFSDAGYRTGAVVSNFNIGRRFGFQHGFDRFVESWEEKWREMHGDVVFENAPGKVKRFADAKIVVDQGLRWLRESDVDRPFFLWLHFMDPHGPFVPPAAYGARFVGMHPPEPVELAKLPFYQLQSRPGTNEPISDLAFYRAQYDREIRYLDDQLARLFDELAGARLDENTLIIFTADHGESFGEHDYYLEHGAFSYQACADVPLIIVFDPDIPAGRTVDEPVGLIDVSATILELCGIRVPVTFEGQSLTGLIDGRAEAPRWVFMESGYRPERSQLTVRSGKWKLIHVRDSRDRQLMSGTPYELYDVYADPSEESNLASRFPDVVTTLAAALDAWYTGGPRLTRPGEVFDIRTADPREVEMLRSLGYLQGRTD